MKTLLAFTLAAGLAAGAHGAETVRYDIHAENGKRIGEQVVERADDGLVTVRFSFKNNGRGPDLTEQFRLAPDGTLAQYAVRGNSTYGAVVDEHFERVGDRASWHSTSETGGKSVSGAGMYVPLNGSFETASIAIAALAARPGASLALLPSGELTQRTLDVLDVASEGQTRTVQLIAQTGLGLSPKLFWATTGARPQLFAVVYPGFMAMTEQGWSGSAKLLAVRQKLAEKRCWPNWLAACSTSSMA